MTENPFDAKNSVQRVVDFYDVLTRKGVKKELPKDLVNALTYHMSSIAEAYSNKQISDSDFEALEASFKKFEGKSFALYEIADALMKAIPAKFQPYSKLPQAAPVAVVAAPAESVARPSGSDVSVLFGDTAQPKESLETILGTASILMQKLSLIDDEIGQLTDTYSGTVKKVEEDYKKQVAVIVEEKKQIATELKDYASKNISVLTSILTQLQTITGQEPVVAAPVAEAPADSSARPPVAPVPIAVIPASEQPKKKTINDYSGDVPPVAPAATYTAPEQPKKNSKLKSMLVGAVILAETLGLGYFATRKIPVEYNGNAVTVPGSVSNLDIASRNRFGLNGLDTIVLNDKKVLPKMITWTKYDDDCLPLDVKYAEEGQQGPDGYIAGNCVKKVKPFVLVVCRDIAHA
ncbi:MAG: hypothetical protein AABW88_05605, partial [Nanoarchaeota archaeon]